MTSSGIYRITNIITDKIYIGSAVDLSQRWSKHQRYANGNYHHSITFQRSWNLYGAKAFIFDIIEYVEDKTKLIEREQFYLDKFKSFDPEMGYNINKKADSPKGLKRSDQARENMRQSQLGKKRTFEHGESIGAANRDHSKWPCDEGSRCNCDRCKKIKTTYSREWRWAKEDERPIVIRELKWSCPQGSLCKCDKCKTLRNKDLREYRRKKGVISGRQKP